jgi:hypothetical protein
MELWEDLTPKLILMFTIESQPLNKAKENLLQKLIKQLFSHPFGLFFFVFQINLFNYFYCKPKLPW